MYLRYGTPTTYTMSSEADDTFSISPQKKTEETINMDSGINVNDIYRYSMILNT